jgi:hypothetical protein
MKKQKPIWMLAMLVACCICLAFTSCSDSDDPTPAPPAPVGPQVDPSVEPIDPVQCLAAVDFGDISNLPAELQTALRNRFPNLTSNADAAISFCQASEVDRFSTQLLRGTTTIVAMPGNSGNMSRLIDIAGGVVPKNTATRILFYATQIWGQHYVMLDGGIPAYLTTTEDKVQFYERRIIPLVHWLNEVEVFKEKHRLREAAAQNDQPYNYDELLANIEDEGLSMKYNFPISLDNSFEFLFDDYSLKASSSVDYGLRVYPLYKQSCHEEKSGDYYMVTAEITPYNQNMWQPYETDLGVWDEMHVVGYWWHEMSTHFRLVDMNGNDIPGLDFNHTPLPENENDSRQYSSGTSNTVGGSASAGFNGSTPTGSLGFSFSHTVSSTVSYSMDVITYNLDSSSPNREVSYLYETKGVQPEADSDMDKYWPRSCRTQWTVRQAWVWFVPSGDATGVGDNKDTTFKIVLSGNVKYQYFWWVWHPISPNESGDTYTYTPLNIDDQEWELQPPHRNSWGLVSIKSEYTDVRMANIKYYLTGKEGEDPVAVDNLSYGNAECALMGLPDNKTYTIIYETKDPNTGEHKDSWKFENVAVHQGKTKDDATTALSSINATKIPE